MRYAVVAFPHGPGTPRTLGGPFAGKKAALAALPALTADAYPDATSANGGGDARIVTREGVVLATVAVERWRDPPG